MSQGIVRPMAPEEKKELGTVMRACFGWLPWLFFDLGKAAFVHELDGRIVGGITLSSFRINDRRQGGVVKWIFTLPEARGHGAAGTLMDRAMAWFADTGCTDVFACVEGYNTSSSNLFASRGFHILPFSEQTSRYGVRLPIVAFRTFHLLDVGHFLWVRVADDPPAAEPEKSSAVHGAAGLITTAVLHVLFGYVMFSRWGRAITPTLLWQIPIVVIGLIGLRLTAMSVGARIAGLRVRYRPWETGLLLAGFIPVVFGGVFIAPGGLYPQERIWRYRDAIGRLGPAACAAATTVLAAGWLAFSLTRAESAPALTELSMLALFYLRAFLVFEIILPIFPFAGFAGRRVLDWNRIVWAALAAGAVGLWVASIAVPA